MKTIKIVFIVALMALLQACTTAPIGDVTEIGKDLVSGIVTPGADPDYTQYVKACMKETEAKKNARKAEFDSLTTALTSSTDDMSRGAILIMAAFKIAVPEKIDCTIDRKIGFIEGIGSNGILGFGMDLFREYNAKSRFKKQIQFDTRRLELELESADNARRDSNNLFRDLVGTYGERNRAPSYSSTTTTSTFGSPQPAQAQP